ncbi:MULTISPECIES: sensor histidine kinase [unclassified Streptomyces]|uniref:sensor histidine kinase n=1 Tax=unclassified Streptomyces TaxID=2593676 RepID=UPI000F7061C4|nr:MULTISPECIES: HAMP domain-containing sensor histidine kinase [unclassified Streptomyces]AZM59626.1 two-component sensor histidine kinase [Streptomyces sp. WAC 01438]RSM92051.1 two-component sensor histidine kinase [Streptomyces sp. WAC 01420]
MTAEVPLRNSLLLRLLLTSLVISLLSIGATAWLTVRGTSLAIEQERGQVLADDTAVQDTLTAFAATHRSWEGVERTVRELADRTGRGIVLTTRNRRLITASDRDRAGDLPVNASAVIDPLHVTAHPGQGIDPAQQMSRIDPRAVGPYRLPADERAELRRLARAEATCLNGKLGRPAYIVEGYSGRPEVRLSRTATEAAPMCRSKDLTAPTRTEAAALAELAGLVRRCAERHGVPSPESVRIDMRLRPEYQGSEAEQAIVDECAEEGRREQLTGHVAPAALLFVTDSPRAAVRVFDLTPSGTLRVVGTTALVLAVTIALTTVIAVRLVRPLRALADAARAPDGRHLRIPVTTKDETGYLAAALNDLSERRERTEEQRRAMVSDIAHELRTPLTNIRGWLDAAQDGIAEPDAALLASLQEEAHLLQHIIDDLQVLAAADAGTLHLNPQAVRLDDLIGQSAAAHRAGARAKDVELVVHTAGGLSVHVDPVRLRQVIGNLLSNAVRHTPPGGRVTLGARRAPRGVELRVTDTGAGIRPEDLPRVFDRFWRGDTSRSRKTGGSGLGLSIVRQLVRAHGGDVCVTSRPGVETAFTIRLPDETLPARRP